MISSSAKREVKEFLGDCKRDTLSSFYLAYEQMQNAGMNNDDIILLLQNLCGHLRDEYGD